MIVDEDGAPVTFDTNPKIPNSNITIMTRCQNMTVHSVPFDLRSSNYEGIKEKKILKNKVIHVSS